MLRKILLPVSASLALIIVPAMPGEGRGRSAVAATRADTLAISLAGETEARVDVAEVRPGGVKGENILLEVNWGIISPRDARISNIMVIAVLVDPQGRRFQATKNFAIEPGTPVPTNGVIAVSHEIRQAGQVSYKFEVTVTATLTTTTRARRTATGRKFGSVVINHEEQ
ncbi:MAG TPA: hypothetical protein VNO70_08615 [Blastocatellia bacterium]|nr:hypothetical protein [Blastocatellia bacterium]